MAIFESYSIANPRNTSVLLWVGSITTSKYDPKLLPEKTKFRIAIGILSEVVTAVKAVEKRRLRLANWNDYPVANLLAICILETFSGRTLLFLPLCLATGLSTCVGLSVRPFAVFCASSSAC